MCSLRAFLGLWLATVIAAVGQSNSSTAAQAQLWPVSPLTKVMRSDRPSQDSSKSLRISGAAGEVVSGQAVFRAATERSGLTAAVSDLRHRQSTAVVDAAAVKLQWVRYIDITRNTAGIPDDELVAKAPTSIPDPYWERAALSVPADTAQPVWIEVHVPAEAQAGDYDATLSVADGTDAEPVMLPVVLHVWNFRVPAQRHVSVVNWWSFPGRGFQQVQPYSETYWDLLRRFCTFLVDHRQTDIAASIGLIREQGDQQHGFSYDSRRLQRYTEVAIQAGIRRIHLHSVGRRESDRIVAQPSSLRRLAAWEKVIQRRQWDHRFLVSISDEPFIYFEDTYPAMVRQVHKIAPHIPCIEAVETEYLGDLDIYVPKLSHLNLWYPRFRQLQREGKSLWFYTCCHPVGRYPNRFLDQSLLKVRVLHWINYLYDLDGYLHWGLNQFAGDNPYSQEGISKGLPLGDRAIAYPGRDGLIGSLRLSAMRDGLQDFEYLWVLEHELARIKQSHGAGAFWLDPRQRPLELCRRVIWSFHDYTRDPRIMLETRREIAEEIEALRTPPLLVVQTSPPEAAIIPAGPRVVNVRGLAPAGATVTLNGKPVRKILPSGYFVQAYFMSDDNPTITVTVEHHGKKRTVRRTMKPTS